MSRREMITNPSEGSTFRWPSNAGVRIAAVTLESVFALRGGTKIRRKPVRLRRTDLYDVRPFVRLTRGQGIGQTTNTTRFLLAKSCHQNPCPSQVHALTPAGDKTLAPMANYRPDRGPQPTCVKRLLDRTGDLVIRDARSTTGGSSGANAWGLDG